MDTTCPNCGKLLKTRPTRKKKCPFCGNYIYVRQGQLVGEDQVVASQIAQTSRTKQKTKIHPLVWMLGIFALMGACCGIGVVNQTLRKNQVSSEVQQAPQSSNQAVTIAQATHTPPSASTSEPTHTPRPSPSSTPTVASIETPPQQTPQTAFLQAEKDVNLHSGPGTNYEIVGVLAAGQSFNIMGRNSDTSWWQIVVDNKPVWVAASVVKASNVDESISIVEVSPPPIKPSSSSVEEAASVTGLQEAQVIYVVDGDTIDVLVNGTEHRVRYILVDTPETKHPEKPVEPFGPEASEANRQLVEGKTVFLEKDVSETDQYGRLLRYVYVGDLMVNEELLRRGMAQVATFPPDVKYVDRFLEVQRQAQAAGVGMWGSQSVTEQPTLTPIPVEAPPVVEAPPPANGSSYSGPYDPFGPDRDCGDFSTHAEAQAFYETAGGPATDRHRLDRDRDGSACEDLP